MSMLMLMLGRAFLPDTSYWAFSSKFSLAHGIRLLLLNPPR